MYEVRLDNAVIHAPALDLQLLAPVLTLTDNKAGMFDFQITPDHAGYHRLHKLTSVIQVFQDGTELFRGRILSEEKSFDGIKTVACEGDLAYLLDSIQRPFVYTNTTPRVVLTNLLNRHNSQVEQDKHLFPGDVTVSDPERLVYQSQWENTLSCINHQLLDRLGGHICLRTQDGQRYLDYIANYNRVSSQVIEFGENLLDYAENTNAGDIVTCVIPLGAKNKAQGDDTQAKEDFLTIAEVNGGTDYLFNQEAVDRFGWITKTIQFSEITDPAELKAKGQDYLNNLQYVSLTLSIKAVDLNIMDVDIEPIRMGDTLRVRSLPHGMDRYFPVLQRTYHLDNPGQDTIVLGDTMPKTINDAIAEGDNSLSQTVQTEIQATNAYLEALKLFSAMASSSVGCYESSETDASGAVIRYWHDKPVLEHSTYVRMSNSQGYFLSSTGYRGPWCGIDKNANALLESLTAKCIIADKVVGGTLQGMKIIADDIKITGGLINIEGSRDEQIINLSSGVFSLLQTPREMTIVENIPNEHTNYASVQPHRILLSESKNDMEVTPYGIHAYTHQYFHRNNENDTTKWGGGTTNVLDGIWRGTVYSTSDKNQKHDRKTMRTIV